MRTIAIVLSSIVSLALVAGCSAGSAPPKSGGGGDTTDPPANDEPTAQASLAFRSPCTASSCGALPSSLGGASSARCAAQASAACGWSAAESDETVSYRPCKPSDCGAEPGASICPSGTTFKGNQCGAENDGACTWTTSCAPPRSTTPCSEDACGPKIEIGVICQDGSTGDLACMKQGSKCVWERTCD